MNNRKKYLLKWYFELLLTLILLPISFIISALKEGLTFLYRDIRQLFLRYPYSFPHKPIPVAQDENFDRSQIPYKTVKEEYNEDDED